MRTFFTIIFMSFMLVSCAEPAVKEYTLEVVAEYPHDTESYTQGLFFDQGQMYESTGVHGKSTFRKVDLETGKALQRLDFDKKYFVEGSVMWKGNLYILTWESRLAFVYDAETLEYKSTWKYPREGWGITTDGKNLIASDGSVFLFEGVEYFLGVCFDCWYVIVEQTVCHQCSGHCTACSFIECSAQSACKTASQFAHVLL